MKQRSLLCPRCRQLISSEDSTCSYCGAALPRGVWRGVSRARKARHHHLINALIALNVGYYLLSLLLSNGHGFSGSPLTFLSPDRTSLLVLGATGTVPVLQLGWSWTLLSANYLHGGILHIFFNMIALRQIAPWVAREFGVSRMFAIYTLSGVGGFLVSVLAGVPFTIGASAAVCGLIGALLYFGRSRGGDYGAAVYREVSGWVLSLAIFGFLIPGINNWGHAGGILFGVIFGKLLGYQEHGRETLVHRVVAFLCAAATLAVLGILGGLAVHPYL